ncbi:MAG TPA: DUF962 domain-containing protein [Pyrinomonadaceae bacterium]|jgi:hypothetical protein
MDVKQYKSFADFYPFYLSEHSDPTCRRLHFVGTILALLFLLFFLFTLNWKALLVMLLCGYGFAWVGHFFFEKNQPATFHYPLYSLCGDFVMAKDILTGKIKL